MINIHHSLSAKLNTSKEDVANASKTSQDILDVLETLVESFNIKEEDVRRKMAEWPGLFGRLEGLLANVTSSNSTAHDAIARGEETLRKAKDMLERLKVNSNMSSPSLEMFCVAQPRQREYH